MKLPTSSVTHARANLYAALEMVTDRILLSVLWLMASLPIITAPAATVALFGVTHRRRTEGEPQLVRAFGRGFLREVRGAWQYGLLWEAILAVLIIDFLIVGHMGTLRRPALILLGSVALGYCWVSVTAVPIYLRRNAGWRQALKHAVGVCTQRPLRSSSSIAVVCAAALLIWVMPLLIVLLPAIVAETILRIGDGVD